MKKLDFIEWLQGSADNSPGGASSKKLSAFWVLVILASTTQLTWLIWAFVHDNWQHLEYIITADFAFVAAALSINAVEKIKDKANIKEEVKSQDEQ